MRAAWGQKLGPNFLEFNCFTLLLRTRAKYLLLTLQNLILIEIMSQRAEIGASFVNERNVDEC